MTYGGAAASTAAMRERPNGGFRFEDTFHENPLPPSKSHYSREQRPPPRMESPHDSLFRGGGGGDGEDDASASVELSGWRRRCGKIVNDKYTQMFVLLLVTLNSVMIGVATFPIVYDNPDISNIFAIIDIIVTVIFTIESIMQICLHGVRRFFKNGWLVFDLVIVVISWVSLEIPQIEAFRVFRVLRFVTRVPRMRMVVTALFSIIPAITAIFTLLMLIFYIFAVMFTALFKDLYADGYTSTDYFGRMDYTLFTLFQILCLDEWMGIALEVSEVYYWGWAIFIAFIVISAFVVVNLLIAVICDALQVIRLEEEKGKGAVEETTDEEKKENGGDGGEGWHYLNGLSIETMRQGMKDMQLILDEMVVTQVTMARKIQHLSIALDAERKRSKGVQEMLLTQVPKGVDLQ